MVARLEKRLHAVILRDPFSGPWFKSTGGSTLHPPCTLHLAPLPPAPRRLPGRPPVTAFAALAAEPRLASPRTESFAKRGTKAASTLGSGASGHRTVEKQHNDGDK